MEIKDRFYYFFTNLIKYLLMVIVCPFWQLWGLIYFLYVVFFVTDGSVVIQFPWKWDWMKLWRD